MKSSTILFAFIALLFSSTLDAKIFDVTIFDLHGNSYQCQVKAATKMLGSEVDEIGITQRLRAVMPDGTNKKIRPGEIKGFVLHGSKSGERVFESQKIGRKAVFLEVISKEGVSFYHHYFVPHGGFATLKCFAVEGADGSITALAKISWRRALSKAFPGVAYFKKERKEQKFTYSEMYAFITGYNNTLVDARR